jgi:hypothetical protein
MALPLINREELDEVGYTVIHGVFESGLCHRLREMADSWLGPQTKQVENGVAYHSWQGPGDHPGGEQVVRKCLELRRPFVTSSNYIHSIRHPICDPVMADATAEMLEIQRSLLYTELSDLRLMQHFYRRTDPADAAVLPPTGAHGSTMDSPNPAWHIDAGFLPSQYERRPRSVFYHTAVALNKQVPGGACFMLQPEAFKGMKRLVATLDKDELLGAWTPEHGAYSIGRYLFSKIADKIDQSEGIEVVLDEGDLLVVDPMMLHAATPNTRGDVAGYSRYMLFTTFFDAATNDHLLPPRGSSAPAIKFPPEMRDDPRLPASLWDWESPTVDEARAAIQARL